MMTTTIIIMMMSIAIVSNVNAELKYGTDEINKAIEDQTDQCFEMKDKECEQVMSIIDNLCQYQYSEACFGDKWDKFFASDDSDAISINDKHHGNEDMSLFENIDTNESEEYVTLDATEIFGTDDN